jgi:hypothetical protein
LQPMSPVLQPPCPLQLFRPLQSCLLLAVSEALEPALESVLQPVMPMVPATSPAIAAEMINVLAVRVIVIVLFFEFMFYCSFDERSRHGVPVHLN